MRRTILAEAAVTASDHHWLVLRIQWTDFSFGALFIAGNNQDVLTLRVFVNCIPFEETGISDISYMLLKKQMRECQMLG